MSEVEKKPIIFMYPINETLAKLKESLEEQEHIEIFEVDVLQEASQLYGTMAPAVVVSSDPKKMLQFLAKNKKITFATSSKSVLISNRDYNYRATRKFDQFGLSEIIKEPISPKTLYYKVNLLIKSLKKKTNPEDENYSIKESSSETEEISTAAKLKLQKSVKTEKTDNFMRGKVMSQEEKKELEKEKELLALEQQTEKELKKKNHAEMKAATDLGGHMEGKGEGQMQDLGGNFEAHTGEKDEPNFDDVVGKNMAGDIEKTEPKSLREKEGLKLEKDNKKERNNNYKEKELGGYMRANITESEQRGKDISGTSNSEMQITEEDQTFESGIEELEKKEEKKKTTNLYLEEQKKKRKKFEEQDKGWGNKKSKDLNLEDDKEEKERAPDGLMAKQPVKKKGTQLDLENEEKQKKRQALKEEEKKRNNRAVNAADDLSGANKGKSSTDEIDGKAMSGKSQFKEQEKKQNNRGEFGDNLGSAPMKGKLGEKQEKNDKEKGTNSGLAFAEGADKKDKDLSQQLGAKAKKEKKENSPFFAEGKKKNNAENKADDIDKYMRSKTAKQLQEEKEKRSVDRAIRQQEQKNGKRPEYTQEMDDNWDFEKDSLGEQQDDFVPKQDRPNLKQVETDLGEQTIDYAKIKKAYEEGGSDLDAFDEKQGEKKKRGYTFESGPSAAKSKFQFLEEDRELKNFEKKQLPDSQEEIVYRPKSKGFENMIKVLNYYQNKDHDMQQTLSQICEILMNEGGMTAFFFNNRNTKDNEESMLPLIIQHELSGDEGIKSEWTALLSDNFANWKEKKVPGWEDHTFQIEKNFYHFPFYEGTQCLGFAIVTFNDSGCADKSGFIETMLENARGIYLEKYHSDGGEINYGDAAPKNILNFAKKDKSEEKEKKGFFSNLFGKKAS